MMARYGWAGASVLLVGAVLWLPATSVALCYALGTLPGTKLQVLPIAAYLYWQGLWRIGCRGVVAAALCGRSSGAGPCCQPSPSYAGRRAGRLRLARAWRGHAGATARLSRTRTVARTGWACKEALQLFSGPHPAYGGVVVGEAYRVDQDKGAGGRFDPDLESTWGKGGSAHAADRSLHVGRNAWGGVCRQRWLQDYGGNNPDAGLLDRLGRGARSLRPGRADDGGNA